MICLQLQSREGKCFPSDALLCADLFRQLLWWTALNDIAQNSNVPASLSSSSSSSSRRAANFSDDTYQLNYGVILKMVTITILFYA